jgi:hypothetical protein
MAAKTNRYDCFIASMRASQGQKRGAKTKPEELKWTDNKKGDGVKYFTPSPF